MSVFSVRIEEFPKNGNPWRLDGLGKVAYPSSSRSEPLIAVHFSELHADFTDALSNQSITGKGFAANVKVGQIALLKPGYVWLDQVRLVHRKKRAKPIKLTISDAQIEFYNFGASIDINGKSEGLVTARRHRLSLESWKGLASSWVAVIRHPTPGIEYMVIPSSVIFQKCMATSPKAVRRLVWGQLNRIVDSPRWIDESNPGKDFFVEVFNDIKSDEAYAHATLYADPVGRREYASLRNNIIINSVNDDRGRNPRPQPTHIKFGFPFSNPITLSVDGKYLRLESAPSQNSRWGFLVTEIMSLSGRLAFERLIAHRKNDNRKGENATDADLKETAWQKPAADSKGVSGGIDARLHSGEDPLFNLEKFCIQEAGGFNPVGFELVKDEKLTQQYRHKKILRESSESDESLTTGDTRNGHIGAHELDIDTEETPALPVTLEDFFQTIDYLRSEGYPISTISVTEASRQDDLGHVVNFLPLNIHGCRSWHLISEGSGTATRAYVVAIIYVGGVCHHFIELQRKGAEAHTLAYVRSFNGSQVEPRAFRMFMKEVAECNGWAASENRPQWVFSRIKHAPKKGVEWFANTILKVLGY